MLEMNEESEALKFLMQEEVSLRGVYSIVMEVSSDNW